MVEAMDIQTGFQKTEVCVIPSDWLVVKLHELVNANRKIRYGIVQPGKYDSKGRYMVRGKDYSFGWVDEDEFFRVSKEIEERYQNARLKGGDIILTIVGAGTGNVALVPNWLEEANITQTTARISINPEKANSLYCKFYLQSPAGKSEVNNYVKGGAQPGLNICDVEVFKLALPPTKAEQTAIAAVLSDADALITHLEKLIAKKRNVKQGAMQELLTGKRRLPGFEQTRGYKQTEIGVIPSDWILKSYGEIFDFLTTATYSRSQLSDSGEIKYVHYGDIHTKCEHFLDCDKIELPSIKQELLKNYPLLKEGDVIVVDASEDYGGVSKSVEIRNIRNHKIISGLHTFLLRDKNEISAEGFKGYIHSNTLVKKQMDRLATGMKVYGVSKTNLKLINIPLPPTKAEQIRIAQILSDMDTEIEALEKKLEKYKMLKQGTMQNLLTGRIRLI